MKLAAIAVLSLFAACGSPGKNAPELARSEVVAVSHQKADVIAARVCGRLHGIRPGSPEDLAGGCTGREHAKAHRADDRSHVSLIPDAGTNSIVVTAAPGHEEDLERAIALVRELDQPATGARATIEGRALPEGAVGLALAHADAREVARFLNELEAASFEKARSRPGCVLYAPKRLRSNSPPPESFRAADARLLVVLEADRDDSYLPRVRELVARLDEPVTVRPGTNR